MYEIWTEIIKLINEKTYYNKELFKVYIDY